MAIKKAYVEVVNFLTDNKDKKISSVLEEVAAMCSAKTGGGRSGSSNSLRDSKGKVVAIFCYYHKMWEPIVGDTAVEYGKKATSSTGLNNMCSEGTSAWGKQNRTAKAAKEAILDKVASGELKAEAIEAEQGAIEKARGVTTPREDKVGFKEVADVAKSLGIEAPAA